MIQPLFEEPLVRWSLTAAYFAVLATICMYGIHRYWLVWLFWKHWKHPQRPARRFDQLPTVTVQLPMYNEPNVAQRAIEAACRLDYPRERLQIQVLDDSTDGSSEENRRYCQAWAKRGMWIEHHFRSDRQGFKAGALAEAMPAVAGELVAIFDADFVPPANFLKRTVHYFTDPKVGMVQTRWGHLNRDSSLLTRSQAIFLDGHFVIEHTARNRAQRWINFNGTAGVWRRQAIEDAGGWQADTLTEDVDLSYRAQLAGWNFVFLPHVCCPAELPPEINAFKSQQHRWTKGSIQTARKLLPRILAAPASTGVKMEAFFHLTSPIVYLLVTMLALLFYPVLMANQQGLTGEYLWLGTILGTGLFLLGTVSASVFYMASQKAQHRDGLRTMLQLPFLMSIGIGIAINNARACLEALAGHESPFVRTPKYNTVEEKQTLAREGALPVRTGEGPKLFRRPSRKMGLALVEVGMGAYMLLCGWLALGVTQAVVSLPFILLFAAGYFYVGFSSLLAPSGERAVAVTAVPAT